jgi:hypothetical protein
MSAGSDLVDAAPRNGAKGHELTCAALFDHLGGAGEQRAVPALLGAPGNSR